MRFVQILQRPANKVSLDQICHFARSVDRHKANRSAFVKHLDELALQGPLDDLEQILPTSVLVTFIGIAYAATGHKSEFDPIH
ncbi:MAG: hypothetical protein NTV52_23560 [Acidobacteria bacterium]|nr:hypothetical protein [Acidobacteriota bacterium]